MSSTRFSEVPVITSFTRIGYDVCSRIEHWTPTSDYRLEGRVVAITGATSGLGRAAAEALARCGATVVVWGRNAAKTRRVGAELISKTGNENLSTVVADIGDPGAVRAAAVEVLERHDRLDVLIHNAGALFDTRRTAPDGTEATVAVHVLGPFLLTSLLLDRLRRSAPARVLTMSSGGLYTAALTVDELEMNRDDYRGTEQYALAKRAQVTLNEMWARAIDPAEVVFHALHPGWADTPGVSESLPRFHKVLGPLLRTPEQGADTLVWLTADDGEPLTTSGRFWLDRRQRPIHRLPNTRRSDTPDRRRDLWAWSVERSGTDPGLEPGPASPNER